VVGIGILLAGAVYWVFWAVLLPKFGGYKLVRDNCIGSDGWSSNVFSRRPVEKSGVIPGRVEEF
jgi:hypothetical protein